MSEIYDLSKLTLVPNISEELKLVCLDCITIVPMRTQSDVLQKFYSKENGIFIGRVTHMAIQIIIDDKYIKIRAKAIQCLLALFQVHDEADYSDIVLRHQIASIVFIFLPKIHGTLLKVLLGDNKKESLLHINAVKAILRIICLIFEDYDKTDEIEVTIKDFKDLLKSSEEEIDSKRSDDEILGKNLKHKDDETKLNILNKIERNTEWMLAASKSLNKSLHVMETIRGNSNKGIRLELVKGSCNIINNCFM